MVAPAKCDMKREDARIEKVTKLLLALDQPLNELESALHLQFDSTANLYDKLAASKRARSAVRKCRRFRNLIAQALEIKE